MTGMDITGWWPLESQCTGGKLRRGFVGGRYHVLALVLLGLVNFGCDSSSSQGTLSTTYPTLSTYLQMDEEDLQAYLETPSLGSSAKDISIDSVGDMTIGAKISSAKSQFIVKPIFDLSLLDKDSFLDKNLSSSSKEVTEIRMVSNKKSATESGQEVYNFSASESFLGFKASASYHQENKRQDTSSDGSVTVVMSYNNYGAYVELITGGFEGYSEYTPYLIGEKIDEKTIKSYVDYVEERIGWSSNKYISKLKINNGGQLSDQENVYANIQLLSEMERIFGILKEQYATYADKKDVRETLMKNMKAMKKYITAAIKAFYAYHGDAAVTYIGVMNYGLGQGELKFSESSGNTEDIYNAAASAGYSGLIGGGGTSADVGIARKNGWATAFKNVNVGAESRPAGVVPTTDWATKIYAMLSVESAPVVVPPLQGLPPTAELELPEPLGPNKNPITPADPCFKSYDDWLKYQNDKKAAAGQDQEQARNAEEEVKEKGIREALAGDTEAGPELYETFMLELEDMESRRPTGGSDTGGNILRVNKMFVTSFKTTPYDRLIAHLRPDLDVPGESKKLEGFPNISKLLLVINQVGKLETYVRFLGNISVSCVNADMSRKFASFSETLATEGFEMISAHLDQGVDIAPTLLASFGAKMFGQTGSEKPSVLYDHLQDIDYCHYINTLLDPQNVPIWADAPGGYMPMGWQNGQPCFLNLTGYTQTQTEIGQLDKCWLVYEPKPYSDPSKNPLALYGENNTTFKTPWFPIFQYNQSKEITLLFLERAGATQIVHGFEYVACPYLLLPGKHTYSIQFNSMNPVYGAKMTASLIDELRQENNSLHNEALIQGYSLHFPGASPDPERNERFKVLVLSQYPGNHAPDACYYFAGYGNHDTLSAYDIISALWKGSRDKYLVDTKTGARVDVNGIGRCSLSDYVVVLLPLNKNTCGDKLDTAFTYSNSLVATNIVTESAYDPTYRAAIFK